VSGEFDGNLANGDEVGLFTGTEWFFDTNHDFRIDLGSRLSSSLRGFPIVGDFDGNGFDDLGVWSQDRFQFDFAGAAVRSFNGSVDDTIVNAFAVVAGFIGVRERPVAADWDGDGIDDVGLFVPDRSGQPPAEAAEWYFLISNDFDVDDEGPLRRITGTANTLDHPFEPVPFGADRFAQFGDEFAIPIVGNFDPPATFPSPASTWHNPDNALDVDRDGTVAPVDALIIINQLETSSIRSLSGRNNTTSMFSDTSGDGELSPLDALMVINRLDGTQTQAAQASLAALADAGLAEAALVEAALEALAPELAQRKRRN
jgi:hypothetical protein